MQQIMPFQKENKVWSLLLILLLSAIIGISSVNAGLLLLILLSTFLVVFIIFVILYVKNAQNLFNLLLLLIVSQNIIVIFISLTSSSILVTIFLTIKEFILYASISFLLIKYRKLKHNFTDFVGVVFILLCFLYLFYPSSTISARIISFRQLISPIALFFFGRLIKSRLKYDFLLKITIFVCSFGLMEFLLGDGFWSMINIAKYYRIRGFDLWLDYRGIPGNFYSYDLGMYIGALRRMASSFADPVQFGQFLVLPLLLLFISKEKKSLKRSILLLLIIVCIILTFSKGALFTVFLSIAIYLNINAKNKYVKLIGVFFLFVTLIGTIGLIGYSFNNHISITNHISGFTDNLSTIVNHPLGRGLATAGNLAVLENSQDNSINAVGNDVGSGESFIGLVIGQLGIIGILIFTIFFFSIFIELIKISRSENKENKSVNIMVSCIVIATFFSSFLTESSLGFLCSAALMILSGNYIGSINQYKPKKK